MASETQRSVMVIGNGGRECALACAILEDPSVERLVITPPNWGVVDPCRGGERVSVLNIAADDRAAIVAAAKEQHAGLVVIGPEAPLCAGLADDLRSAGVMVVGPGRDAARLEGSKAYAKEFMRRHGMPTADFALFDDIHELERFIAAREGPLVLKADGLAAGKGVIVCEDRAQAQAAARRMLTEREFGESGSVVVAEQRLFGREISFTCLIAGSRGALIAESTDYKRLRDNDAGPNTGGMGNICPTPYVTVEVREEFQRRVFRPFLDGLAADGLDYRGFLFIGAMLTERGLEVLEFNVRLGDPEAQVVLPMLDAPWSDVLTALAAGELPPGDLPRRDGACVAVVLASGNYPYSKSAPAVIEGIERIAARGLLMPAASTDGRSRPQPAPVRLYFSGVSREETYGGPERDEQPGSAAGAGASGSVEPMSRQEHYANYFAAQGVRYFATGGRVLCVSALGRDLSDARQLAYEVVGNLRFDAVQFRSDIGKMR